MSGLIILHYRESYRPHFFSWLMTSVEFWHSISLSVVCIWFFLYSIVFCDIGRDTVKWKYTRSGWQREGSWFRQHNAVAMEYWMWTEFIYIYTDTSSQMVRSKCCQLCLEIIYLGASITQNKRGNWYCMMLCNLSIYQVNVLCVTLISKLWYLNF